MDTHIELGCFEIWLSRQHARYIYMFVNTHTITCIMDGEGIKGKRRPQMTNKVQLDQQKMANLYDLKGHAKKEEGEREDGRWRRKEERKEGWLVRLG